MSRKSSPYKAKESQERIHLTTSPERKNKIEKTASELNVSNNLLIKNAVDKYLGDQDNFVLCPKCKAHVAEKISIEQPTVELTCGTCGKSILYVVEGNKTYDVKTPK